MYQIPGGSLVEDLIELSENSKRRVSAMQFHLRGSLDNAQTTSEHLQNNFGKVQQRLFETEKCENEHL